MNVHDAAWAATWGFGAMFATWLIVGAVMRRRGRRADPWALADTAYDVRKPEWVPRERAINVPGPKYRLPSQEYLTQELESLRSDCVKCGTDHVGDCDVKVGRIVDTVTDMPAFREESAFTTSMSAVLREMSNEWHWIGGELHPPAGLVDSLRHGDWLRDLLVQGRELVAA